jgi:multidrug efflux pump
MGGIFGRLFREFAVTLAVAVGVSMVVSLTTTPMMCAYLLRSHSHEGHGWLYRANEWVFQSVLRLYELTLAWVLRHQFLILLVTLTTIYVTVRLYIDIPKGFFPQQDTGALSGTIQADQSSSFQAMRHLLQQFAALVGEDPAVENVVGFTGGQAGAVNTARLFVALKPLAERQISADEVIARLRGKAARVPGARLIMP